VAASGAIYWPPTGTIKRPLTHDHDDLADATLETLRYRILHVPARLAAHARRRTLHLPEDWPWTGAIITCWTRRCALDPG
jgi:hypothetical protein